MDPYLQAVLVTIPFGLATMAIGWLFGVFKR